jgi:predicted nucleic-acid-binding protein
LQAAVKASRMGKGHFADHMIAALARSVGCRTTYTFEKGLGPAAGFTQV